MKRNHKRISRITGLILFLSSLAINTIAQSTLAKEKEVIESANDRLFFVTLFMILAGLGGAYYFWRRSRKDIEQPESSGSRNMNYFAGDSFEASDVDAEKELEWLRKAKR